MGSGYLAGAVFFARTFRGQNWHRVSAGVLSAAIFALLMLVATLIHWSRFNHGHAVSRCLHVLRLGHLVSPGLIGVLWLSNQRTGGGQPEPRDALVAPAVRLTARAAV